MKKKLVVLTGAGVSAESGIDTFRGDNGLWENFKIEEIASIQGWRKDPEKVLNFYNERRRKVKDVVPNRAHEIIAELEKNFDVTVITQNIDDLHERAGSSNVLHLHGEILKSRSNFHYDLVYDCIEDINIGDICEKGHQLRPHIVWFGEQVPLMDDATEIVEDADILLVVGTSLQVYPAANLVHYARHAKKYLIDPNDLDTSGIQDLTLIKDVASKGMNQFKSLVCN